MPRRSVDATLCFVTVPPVIEDVREGTVAALLMRGSRPAASLALRVGEEGPAAVDDEDGTGIASCLLGWQVPIVWSRGETAREEGNGKVIKRAEAPGKHCLFRYAHISSTSAVLTHMMASTSDATENCPRTS